MKHLLLIVAATLLMTTPVYAQTKNPECTHVHDADCGFNLETQDGCTHVCCTQNPRLRTGCEWCPVG